MEFVKIGKKYMIKGSNGRIVSEKEKLQLENRELVIKDIISRNCQKETTKKISKNKKRIAEIEKEENIDYKIEDTALEKGESADDIIKEADKSI